MLEAHLQVDMFDGFVNDGWNRLAFGGHELHGFNELIPIFH